jgi:predicted extracellular nuclease
MSRTKITFATCNLYNLNEPGVRIYSDLNGWSQEEYDKKIKWTAQIINSIRADVWGFQELWHADSLDRALAESGLAGTYTALAPPNQTGQHIVCGGAVRTDILVGEPEWIETFPDFFKLSSQGDDDQTSSIDVRIDRFSRPVLHFKIKPRSNGRQIHVYVCHFKSKGPTKVYRESWYDRDTHSKHREAIGSAISTIRRTAEAMAMRLILTEQMKGNNIPVVLMGDLNDSQHSNTLNILTGQPNYLLSGLAAGGSDVDLYSAGTLQEYRSNRDVYYTHVFHHSRESLDHILVSQEFYDNSKKRLWAFKGMNINNDHLNSDDHKSTGTSDHGVVSATFEYRPV